MGFLKTLFTSVKNASVQKEGSTHKHDPKSATPKKSVKEAHKAKHSLYQIVLEGDTERTVYTYDGVPLKGTRKGSTLYADVVTEHIRLHSKATGSDWDSSDGGVALAVNGKPFGMTSTMEKTFKELKETGYDVKVKIKRLGMYCEGIPQIVLMIPEPEEIFHWRDACRALGHEVPFEDRHNEECELAAELENERHRLSRSSGLELPIGVDGDIFFINDEDWPGAKPDLGNEHVEISSAIIPTPKGSSAKPHVTVSVSGKMFVELTARNRQYPAMARHVGEKPYAATCQRYMRDDETFCWQVTVVYFPQESK